MKDVRTIVEDWLSGAARAALGLDHQMDPLVRAAKDPKFGDYQANLAMPLAKQLKQNPRKLAQQIVEHLLADEGACADFSSIEVAGPGFINLTLSQELVNRCARQMLTDERLGVPKSSAELVVLDYSSPNLAKEMHVGHLRSTVIGDALYRVLSFRGDDVIRQNHIGDWGTQFGMLLENLIDQNWAAKEGASISDLNVLYQEAKKRFDSEPDFMARARQRVVALQQGDKGSLDIWRQLIGESKCHMNDVYARLGVCLHDDDLCAESFYNSRLQPVVEDLRAQGSLMEDAGAQVVFPDGFKNKEGDRLPLIVQKSDGGFGYAATDLAAGRYRVSELNATRIIYVVDSRQSDHFAMVFWALREAGWAPEDSVKLEHVAFGMILGNDRRPFRSRDGGTVRLVELLDEATQRARKVVDEKAEALPEAERAEIARVVAMGALKYADLSSERIKDYVFDYDRMLALEGNTAPYLQYPYSRIQSIFREGNVSSETIDVEKLDAQHPAERALVLQLLKLPRVIDAVAESLEPHRLCGYLYDLASAFHYFYNKCKVLKADTEAQRLSRLALCHLTARTLKQGLSLLGIECVERM